MPEEERPRHALPTDASGSKGRERRRGAPPHLFYNWLSIAGAVVAVGGVTGAFFFSLLDVVREKPSTYPGVMLLPFLVPALLGCVLVLVGMGRERRRRTRGLPPSVTASISIDLAQMTGRRPLFFIIAGTVATSLAIFGGGFAVTSAVEFTESNYFCGEVCHDVMSPESQAFHMSPHSQLQCVDCHVATGTDGYLFSKLNGLRQVATILADRVKKPIPTPIHDMRPARELCETCHSPDRLVGFSSYDRRYFLADEQNSQVDFHMLVDVGGKPRSGKGAGIHYHMVLDRTVEYVARDAQRQQIAWVRMTRPDGSVVEYNDAIVPLSDEERATLPVRVMDCLDCHNRPAHQFAAPTDAVNELLADGAILRELPYIKREAVIALDGDYETTEEAMLGIETSLRDFYAEEEPDVLEEQGPELAAAVGQVQQIYRDTIFPEMEARWSSYPDNIGHRDWPGCFRCHNEDMVSSEDDVPIFQSCDRCHTIFSQGQSGAVATVSFPEGQEFVHPEDDETFDEFTDCTECHTGGAELYE